MKPLALPRIALACAALAAASTACDKLRGPQPSPPRSRAPDGAGPGGAGFSLAPPGATAGALEALGGVEQRLVVRARSASGRATQSVYTRVRLGADRVRAEVETTDQEGRAVRSLSVREGGALYVRDGSGRCTGALRAPEAGEGAGDPLTLLPAVRNAAAAGEEVVGGERCRKYTFDQRAVSARGAARAEGALWVAVDGRWVVRYALRATDASGERAWEYTAARVGAGVALRPAECGAVLEDVPAIEGATREERATGALRYETERPVAAVRSFAARSLAALGYAQRFAVREAADEALVVFEHAGSRRFALLAARREGGVTRVHVQVADPPSAEAAAAAPPAPTTPQPAPTLPPAVAALARFLPDALAGAPASDPPNGTATTMLGMRTTMAMRNYRAGARALRVMLSQGDVARMSRALIAGGPTDRQAAQGARRATLAGEPAVLTVDGGAVKLQCVLGGVLVDLHLDGATAAQFEDLTRYAEALDLAAIARAR